MRIFIAFAKNYSAFLCKNASNVLTTLKWKIRRDFKLVTVKSKQKEMFCKIKICEYENSTIVSNYNVIIKRF